MGSFQQSKRSDNKRCTVKVRWGIFIRNLTVFFILKSGCKYSHTNSSNFAMILTSQDDHLTAGARPPAVYVTFSLILKVRLVTVKKKKKKKVKCCINFAWQNLAPFVKWPLLITFFFHCDSRTVRCTCDRNECTLITQCYLGLRTHQIEAGRAQGIGLC